jgi:hypothetical protein
MLPFDYADTWLFSALLKISHGTGMAHHKQQGETSKRPAEWTHNVCCKVRCISCTLPSTGVTITTTNAPAEN